MPSQHLNRRLILAGKIALAVSLLTWLLLSGRLQLGRLASVSLDWRLAVLLALVAGSMILPAFRWWWLLRIQGLREPLGKILRLTWAGYLAALVLPGAASGDLAKTYLILRRRSQTRARAFSTVLADRFLGLHSLFCLGALSVVWIALHGEAGVAGRTMAAAILVPLAAMTIALPALLWRPTRRSLFRILPAGWRDAWDESFVLYYAGLRQVLGCFGLSLLSNVMTVASLAVAGRLLGQMVTWDAAFLAGPLIVVANCVPITPGGIGLAEAASSELFAHLGLGGGAEIMILLRACGFLLSLPGIVAAWELMHSARMTGKQGGEAMAVADCRAPKSIGDYDAANRAHALARDV
jgi:uncharacterized membrane protein YbhN (UPF0104 family)